MIYTFDVFSPGNPAWGIAYWIDGELIPELVVARNKTYTFIIEGGNDPAADARYHPFYITSSTSGGRIDNIDNSVRNISF